MKIKKLGLLFFSIAILLIFSFCQRTERKTEYNFDIKVIGDVSAHFSNISETRRISINAYQTTIVDGEQMESVLLDASNISIKLEKGEVFSISQISSEGKELSFNLGCSENKMDNSIFDALLIEVDHEGKKAQKTIKLVQEEANIRVSYIISYNGQTPYILPNNGGSFDIPFICYKRYTINNNSEDIPSTLHGLKYEIYYINSGWIHFTNVIKDNQEEGRYFFRIIANGFYNMDYKSEWYIRILSIDNTEIFKLEFIHNQTPGEDYYISSKTNISRGTFDI